MKKRSLSKGLVCRAIILLAAAALPMNGATRVVAITPVDRGIGVDVAAPIQIHFSDGFGKWSTFGEGGAIWVLDPIKERVGNTEASPRSPFSIKETDGEVWLTRPDGERFFSLGVCYVKQGFSREEFDRNNPGYAAWRHYPDAKAWAEDTLNRLKSWGFTTVGAWSDFDILKQSPDRKITFAPVLHIGSTAGAPWWDMWDPQVISRMDKVAAERMAPLRGDARVIGYFSDNEMGWWNATLFKMTLEQAATSGQRQRLIKLLRETYRNDWAALIKDFEPEGVTGWEDLDKHGMLYLRPAGRGVQTMRRFLELVAERYYSLVHEIIRKHDGRGLFLGDRYQSFYYPEVARACARHVDAVSTNLNVSWNDGMMARFYLDTLRALTAKPILVSEFYMAAEENRSGNKNSHGVFPVVRTQAERAAGFQKTIESLLRIPYVIGADWFQYADEPTHGRYDGENFNFGLVDIDNRPYDLLVSRSAAIDPVAMKSQSSRSRLDASHGVPRAPQDPLGQFVPMVALRDWDRERGFVRPVSEFPLADLYVCWNEGAIYLGLYSQDVVEEAYYRDRIVPTSDRAEWMISIAGAGQPISTRLGAGIDPVCTDHGIRVVNRSGLNLDVRNIAAIELPAKLFGRERFKAGDTIEFGSTLLTHCRAHRVEWKGTFTLDAKR